MQKLNYRHRPAGWKIRKQHVPTTQLLPRMNNSVKEAPCRRLRIVYFSPVSVCAENKALFDYSNVQQHTQWPALHRRCRTRWPFPMRFGQPKTLKIRRCFSLTVPANHLPTPPAGILVRERSAIATLIVSQRVCLWVCLSVILSVRIFKMLLRQFLSE